MIKYFLILTASVGLVACSSSKNSGTSSKTNTSRQTIACAEQHITGNHLDWHPVDNGAVTFPKGAKLPTDYKIYTLDTAQVSGFFKSSSKSWKTVLPLPEPTGCQISSLKESSAMSEELKQKFPNTVSLQGQIDGNAQSDVRLDYDGKRLRGMVRVGSEQYVISPVENAQVLYYLVFNKQNNNIPKKPYEQQMQGEQQKRPTYDR